MLLILAQNKFQTAHSIKHIALVVLPLPHMDFALFHHRCCLQRPDCLDAAGTYTQVDFAEMVELKSWNQLKK
jgi:hypothetical protein